MMWRFVYLGAKFILEDHSNSVNEKKTIRFGLELSIWDSSGFHLQFDSGHVVTQVGESIIP